jgi:sugar lactone lactonase YvrE
MRHILRINNKSSMLWQAVLWILLLLAAGVRAQQAGQDYWQGTGRTLAVPTPSVSRKCIAISGTAIYVGTLNATSKCAAIEEYSLTGAFVKTWTPAFTDVGGLAVDSDGSLYVFDQGTALVRVYSSAGTLTRSWGGIGTSNTLLSGTSGYMVNAIAVDASKNVYVADWGNRRIQVFDGTGTYKQTIGQQGDLPGQFQNGPAAVACAPDGSLLAYDTPINWYHISRFSSVGVFLQRTAQYGGHSVHEQLYGLATSGYGGDRAFVVSRDSLLLAGAESSSGVTQIGASRLFQVNNLALIGVAAFPTYVTTRGAAFDATGNVWAVRDKAVECLERRMRFDVHKPLKALPQPAVLKVSQQAGSSVVDVDFTITDNDSAAVETAMVTFVGGSRTWSTLVLPKTFPTSTSGILGTGVPTGVPLRASWNAAPDMPGQNFTSLAFEILAKDDRDYVGVHYVTIPADGSNPAALKISNSPVADADLWDLWLWLLAKGDTRLVVSSGKVMLTTEGQTFISGAPALLSGTSVANTVHNGTVTTTQGRQFAYKLLNCRPITAPEKVRALAGNYSLTSVTDNSVISLVP